MDKIINSVEIYIGYKIFEHRKKKGLTQAQLAKKIGVTRVTIANIETGKNGLRITRLMMITEALNISPMDILPSDNWYKENKGKCLRRVVTFEEVLEPTKPIER